MQTKHLLKNHAAQNVPLSYEEAYALGQYALEGCKGNMLAQIQSICTLTALHTRATYSWKWTEVKEIHHGHRLPQNAAEQIAGACAAIFDHDIAPSEFGFLKPNVRMVMDNCGMGGDLVRTSNVSTLAALIAATAGIPMCKHGSPGNTDNHGSSDFVDLLGINTYASRDEVARCVEELQFGYTEALDVRYKRIHLQTHQVAQLPHMNDIIGPITNPVDPNLVTRRVLGVNHLVSPRLIAEAYNILNERGVTALQHGIFVRGFVDGSHYEGMDEVSVCEGGTQVAELRNGEIREFHLSPSDFGILPVEARLISPPQGMSKGEFSLRILRREISGPAVQMVLANAALLFYLAGRSESWKECYALAKEVYESGEVCQRSLAIAKRLPKK